METNLCTIDRVTRGAVGAILIAVGLFVVHGAFGAVFCLVGAMLVFSGIRGFCHVYKVLNIRTSKKP